MTFYIAIVFALWIQTGTGVKSPVQSLLDEARVEFRSGHFAAAEKSLLDALGQLDPSDEVLRAEVLGNLGDVYSEEEEFRKAEDTYRESLALSKRLAYTKQSALMQHNLGMLYSREGRNDEALALLENAVGLSKSAGLNDPGIAAQLLDGIGIVYYRKNKTDKAEKSFNQALAIIRSSNIEFNTAGVLNNLGAVYLRERKFKQAEQVVNQALRIKEAARGQSDPDLTTELNTLAAVYTASGRHALAKEQYERALKILEPHRDEFATTIARILHSLSATYSKLGLRLNSDEALAQAARIAGENLQKDSQMAQILEDYSRLLKSRGNTQEAASLLAQARRARAAADLVIRTPPEF